MFKTLMIAVTLTASIISAVSIAGASNGKASDVASIDESVKNLRGILNCKAQIWPHIDAYCLSPVSEGLVIRQVRMVNL